MLQFWKKKKMASFYETTLCSEISPSEHKTYLISVSVTLFWVMVRITQHGHGYNEKDINLHSYSLGIFMLCFISFLQGYQCIHHNMESNQMQERERKNILATMQKILPFYRAKALYFALITLTLNIFRFIPTRENKTLLQNLIIYMTCLPTSKM